ncbi:putative TIR domain, P-loop containing nucleoside triphosphate hydrolase [Helianthus annuus]|uniref:ADP-ribosyl cyclase/cyclic ADP-ribose hydrolase n=1 Tax=Helianthus annuus TaxID=4232 RepID=A0A251V4E9_HELAN|nr:disease resistance protein RUN1 isoform X1 [Helianthus annuus]XP_022027580.1 disease resistance protein RUN1 isoform X1 [Helianthus annuus]XP_035843725.1 disease resistance protein RUN1 isoform X1 [Helianthus annuus]KAF5813868.1 putative TIR domain, P-loop containing nucleoside triphosphate hydrolase [Helianthus annuus]KAJ0592561.1 putative TIR domain, P-loop containing nucleoside triphosphate hydrolase [Helianthus annuus]KAJ0600148.1 putative TIR domain, P-loop containing nucleoside tripho
MALSSRQQAYDVFVSFRYEDISKTFMDHLFSDLKRKGIHAYGDNNQLTRGEESSFEAIEHSRVILVIFSHNYASSTLCLKELVKILECKKSENDKYEVWPIFYDVTPAVVRNQRGSYEEAIMIHEASNEKEVIKWKKALTSAGNLSGWDLQNTTNGYESKFIDIILKEIFNKLIDGPIPSGDSLVGLYARAEQMNLSQFAGSDKVHTIGICGIGGIGKTSVAKAIYNLMYKHFEACSFCEDVNDVVNRNGLVYLQTKLLDDILKDGDPLTDLKIPSVGEGVCIMKRRMKGKKIFIVLDDVDNQNQFEALAGNPDWFNPGSLIVVTSRDRQLLKANHVEHVYEIDPLNDDEARELFNKYAFKGEHPPDEFIECTNGILDYVNGHPLALKTIGSSLFNKTLHEWEREIDNLQHSSNALILIHQVLRVSYNGLDADQKNIFLDIACFFRGEKKDYVLKILDVCESSFSTNLRVLVDKSLISICGDRIQMHNLVQQMGRQIIREESEEPAKQSRLWSPTDVLDVLKNNKGTEFVKGLALDLSSSKVNIDGQSFKKLKNLRLLHIYNGALGSFRDTNGVKCRSELWKETNMSAASGKLEFLSNELQLLCWHGYPFQHLPSSFCPESLLVLDLSFSCIKQVWSRSKGFKTLTLLNLSHCHNLRKTPDFTETPNIKELILDGCENLVKVHPSIGTLKTLIILSLKNCKNLKILPNITKLESLENLNLFGCSKIKNLVKSHPLQLSSFIRKLHGPVASVLPSLSTLGSLRVLNVSHCNLSGASVRSLETLCSLEELDMSVNDFTSINANLSRLSRLSCLRLMGCKKLQFLPNLPSSILNLDAQRCISLQELPKLSTEYSGGNAVFDFKNCLKAVENRAVESLLTVFLPQGRIDIFEEVNIFLPGSSIPGWFGNQRDGDTITMELPPHWHYKKLKGLATCVVITPENTGNRSTYFEISCSVKNLHGDLVSDVCLLSTDDPNIESDQIWVWYKRSDPRWMKVDDRVMVSFKCVGINCKVKRCGVRLVVEDKAAVAIEDEQ